jgi:sigma-E factor negative regulatory protein RseB
VLQAVYSDGLANVSLFIEPHVAGVSRRETPATVGSTSALSRRLGDWWVTAVGAVPPATLQQFTGSLERKRKP